MANVPIENVIIHGPWLKFEDPSYLFGKEPFHVTDTTDLSRLLVELGIYKSTTQARKAGRSGEVPTGWTEYKASKKRFLWIWNPTEEGFND